MKTPIQLCSGIRLVFMAGILLTTAGYAATGGYTQSTTSGYTTNTQSRTDGYRVDTQSTTSGYTTKTQTTTKVSHKTRSSAKSPGHFASKIPATGRGVFIFDPRRTAWAAYSSEGKLLRTGAASGGRNYCPDLRRRCHTPTGTFRVYAVQGASCKSTKFPLGKGGAPMPYCAYFRGGYAVHGSYHVPRYNASHGCIRVHPSAAAWLSRNILRPGGTVIVRPY